MKRVLKQLLLPILILTLCFASGVGVQAAKKITVTYKNKTVTLVGGSTKYSTIKKAWGASNKTVKLNSTAKIYTYKKGKSTLSILSSKDLNNLYYELTFKDKNMALNGVKVGMKKATAISKLKKAFGSSKVKDNKKGKISVSYTGFRPIEFSYKSDKITKIYMFTM